MEKESNYTEFFSKEKIIAYLDELREKYAEHAESDSDARRSVDLLDGIIADFSYSFPIEDVAPIVHGHWIVRKLKMFPGEECIHYCSVCGNIMDFSNHRRCNCCDAYMDEPVEQYKSRLFHRPTQKSYVLSSPPIKGWRA